MAHQSRLQELSCIPGNIPNKVMLPLNWDEILLILKNVDTENERKKQKIENGDVEEGWVNVSLSVWELMYCFVLFWLF